MAVLVPITKTPPLTFADIEKAWKDDPYITYNDLAQRFGVSVTDLMGVIDTHIAHAEAADG